LVVTSLVFFSDKILGGLVGILEVGLESVESFGSDGLGLLSGLGSLLLNGSSSLGMSVGISLLDNFGSLGSEWVKSVHHSLVLKWVLLGLVVHSDGRSLSSELRLNLIRVDDSGQVGASHNVSVHGISNLLNGVLVVGSEDGVQFLEGTGGEDDESSEVTTWGELEDVESSDVAGIDTWQVSSGSLDTFGFIVIDDQWSLSQDVLGVSVFSLSGSSMSRGSDLVEVFTDSEVVEGGDERLGVWEGEVVEDEWELWDIADGMASGHHKRSNS